MRLLLRLALSIAALLLATPAGATSDSGDVAEVLAFAGPGPRYAILRWASIQVGCSEGLCRAAMVDLKASEYRELEPRSIGGEGEDLTDDLALARYLALLGDAAPSPIVPSSQAEKLDVQVTGDEIEAAGHRLRLTDGAPFASMAAYDSLSGLPCWMSGGNRCSTCKQRAVPAGSRSEPMWVCEARTGTVGPSQAPCRCDAQGRRLLLEGPGFVSRTVLIAPSDLAQNMMSGPDEPATTDMALIDEMSSARRLPDGTILVLAAIAHTPMANGTYFSLVAFEPGQAPAKEIEVEPAVKETGGVSVTPLATPPDHHGCGSCVLGPRPVSHGWPGFALLGLIAIRRLSSRSRRL
ncbi:MAG: hypothetical protein KC731_01110 [Myxococcales bacterium]|nr:hypothetical protein [Myxococcales bacterium]